jgi:hypothetical protein
MVHFHGTTPSDVKLDILTVGLAAEQDLVLRAFSVYSLNEFSFLNSILVVTATRAPISKSAMPTLGFRSDGRWSRPKEYPHVK